MIVLLIDQKGVLWKIDKWNCYVVHHGPAPPDATVIKGEFDGFTASAKQFDATFGRYHMRVASQKTTYELTITELVTLMAEKLNVSESKVTIRFKTTTIGDDRFGTESTEPSGIEVIVDGPTPS
jgi:hypothetical protein